ncbi:hypothetical protein [Isoalcanivorax beigongshangi]|uniref:Uncharacterized protein n=1 Tax=Isoalcanivorax beigongshangi TaxID=3238810 RepID=A0ABV4AI63_9GAMM
MVTLRLRRWRWVPLGIALLAGLLLLGMELEQSRILGEEAPVLRETAPMTLKATPRSSATLPAASRG